MLRVKDWSKLFENNRTREMKRMEWVPVPNRMDGLGYSELVDHPNGAAHLGAWLAIIEIASKVDVRGTLPREGAEIPQALARISRLPAEVFVEVIPRLLAIGWLEEVTPNQIDRTLPQEPAEIPQEGAEIPQEPAERQGVTPQDTAPSRARAERNGTERNGRERNGTVGRQSAEAETAPTRNQTDRPTEPELAEPQSLGSTPRDAMAAYFPSPPDAEIVERVVQAARGADPAITDAEIAIWVHALVPDEPKHKPRKPAWFERVLGDFVRERLRDVQLLRAFVSGQLPASEAAGILADGKCDWRVRKALRVWMALAAEVVQA